MPKVKSSDWKHLQFNVFIMFFLQKYKKHVLMFFYLQMNVF